jgi:cell division protease FtsH
MCSALGGRVAEELIFGKISTGAMNDLEKITKQAYAMNAYFGMSEKVGHLSFYDSTGQSEMAFNKPYSEKTAELIDSEVKKLVEEAYKRTYDLLKKHKDGLTELAEILLEKEVIFSDDLERIFGKRPWKSHHEKEEEVKKEIEEKEKKAKAKLKSARSESEKDNKKETVVDEKKEDNIDKLEEKEEKKITE